MARLAHVAIATLCAAACVSSVAAVSGASLAAEPATQWADAPDFHLSLSLDQSTGNFSILLDGEEWFSSNLFALRSEGQLYTNQNGGLRITATTGPSAGQGPFGAYTAWSMTWTADNASSIRSTTTGAAVDEASVGRDGGAGAGVDDAVVSAEMVTTFYLYPSVGPFGRQSAIVFEQYFPQGLNNTAVAQSRAAADDVIAAFPTLGPPLDQLSSNLTYINWADIMCKQHVNSWSAGGVNTYYFGLINAAVAWYNASLATAVLSALDNHMVSALPFAASLGHVFAHGLNGRVEQVPAGWKASSIMVVGQGMNDTMDGWGSLLLQVGNKTRAHASSDNNYLTYWTDNGAYYYYKTEQGKDYQDTVADIVTYFTGNKEEGGLNLPLGGFQYDSWWYYKTTPAQSLTLWEPRPDVFPQGFNFTLPATMPLTLHNRYFAAVNNYSADYTFIVEPDSYSQDGLALPIDKNLFLHIMSKGKAWGMSMYEQDWLSDVYNGMNATQGNVTAAHDWLKAMNEAALELNLTIQYCMASPRHILASTTNQAVTNARASGDYHLWYWYDQWAIGTTGLFYHSVGLQPSKDDFWTMEYQPGNPFGANVTEPNSLLHALIATLSTGPVGPSDRINGTNATLLWHTMRAGDALLLKADKPATTMDVAFAQAYNPAIPLHLRYEIGVAPTWDARIASPEGVAAAAEGAKGVQMTEGAEGKKMDVASVPAAVAEAAEVLAAATTAQAARHGNSADYLIPDLYHTYSSYPLSSPSTDPTGAGVRWHYIAAARLPYPITLTMNDVGPTAGVDAFVAVDWFSANMSSVYGTLNATSPLVIPDGNAMPDKPSAAYDLRYIILAPVLPGGWALLGEVDKFATMSRQRIQNITLTTTTNDATAGSTATIASAGVGGNGNAHGSGSAAGITSGSEVADGFTANIIAAPGEYGELLYAVVPPASLARGSSTVQHDSSGRGVHSSDVAPDSVSGLAWPSEGPLLSCSEDLPSHLQTTPDCGGEEALRSYGIGARYQFASSPLFLSCPARGETVLTLSCSVAAGGCTCS